MLKICDLKDFVLSIKSRDTNCISELSKLSDLLNNFKSEK
jgi:hypothetical protein